jgi:hypothetical protein
MFPQENRDALYRRFQRRVDRLCFLIVANDTPRQQIELERMNLRAQAMSLFPEKLELYDMIYESRFRRLWEQFRQTEQSPETASPGASHRNSL